MTDTAKTTFDPNLLNLHQLMNQHFVGIAPLIANELSISIGQARLLLIHAIDASLIFILKKEQNGQHDTNHNYAITHKSLYNSVLDLYSLKRITIKDAGQLFFDKSEEIIKRLSLLAKVAPHIAKQSANIIATLCQHYVAVLKTDGKLDGKQYQEWLGLQALFLAKYKPSQFWSAIAQYTPPTPTITPVQPEGNEQFAEGEYGIPNQAFLLTLAKLVQQKYQKPLTIGKTACPNDFVFDEPLLINTAATPMPVAEPVSKKVAKVELEKPSNARAWLVSGAVMATVVGVFAVPKLMTDKPSDDAAITTKATANDKKADTKTQQLGHQDIAVVRVKDDEKDNKKTDKAVKKSDEKAEKAKLAKEKAEQEKAEKLAAKKAKAEQERLAKEKAEQEKAERAEKAKLEKERKDKERADKERAELAKAKAEKAKAEQLRAEKAEKAKLEKEKADKERAERLAKAKEREKEKAELAKAEKARAEKAKLEKEKADRAKAEKAQNSTKTPSKTVAKADSKANQALTTLPATTQKANKPEPKAEPKAEPAITFRFEPSPVSSEPARQKNKNKNNAEPIINQDTIGKIGGDSENTNGN